ncbi:MAG: phosphate ABC transporter substrate-binding protein [Bacteroidales bacterium]
MRRRTFIGLVGGVGLAASGTRAQALFGAKRRLPLLIGGSSTMLQFTRALVEGFTREHNAVDTVVEGGGSQPGLVALKRGAIDLAAMSVGLTVEQDEVFIRAYLVARDCLGVVVHPSNPLSNLTAEQMRDLFTGAIRNWRDVGGNNEEVIRFVRPQRAATQVAAESLILGGHDLADDVTVVEDAEQMIDAVQSTPAAIGFLALHRFTPKVKLLRVGGVEARRETILSGRYPFTRSFYYVLRSESPQAAQDFLTFAIGPKGRDILTAMDLVPAF